MRMVLVAAILMIVALSPLLFAGSAEALDLRQIPQNLGVAFVNIPGSLYNGWKSAVDEVDKRGLLGVVSAPVPSALNIGSTAASSGLTLGTLGLVPPVKNAWSGGPPPLVLPK